MSDEIEEHCKYAFYLRMTKSQATLCKSMGMIYYNIDRLYGELYCSVSLLLFGLNGFHDDR